MSLVDLDRTVDALSLTPSRVYLDCGCGRGNFSVAEPRAVRSGARNSVKEIILVWPAYLDQDPIRWDRYTGRKFFEQNQVSIVLLLER